MELSLPYSDFKEYVAKQIEHFFPDKYSVHFRSSDVVFDLALERTEYCFKDVTLKAYYKDGHPFLNHLHSDQYTVFLWFLSNSIWYETSDEPLANKIFYLNKALHGFSCMYDTKLPDIFLLLHNVGTVLGKAEYSDYLVVAQGCTVGAQNGKYPRLGKGVALLPNSSIIGNCTIGDRVSIGIGTTVYQRDVESQTVLFTDSNGVLKTKKKADCWVQNFYNVKI
ncbi:hypothetical protein PASE110613_08355 [Paenibacillus sediminis]|uniref:Serine O-acetyltransferase n=1 Tax=Paenibacillus sediminis TaxID=664909 RepID=A0ABS4H280_9BACL|nr:hypothetical protein [Paenibacillus sediminis]MBP1936644.1 serine O-acetyltransferase [Paenibacillus sediminis]